MDGVGQSAIVTFATAGAALRASNANSWRIVLAAAGSHTIDLRCNKTAATGSQTVNSTHSRLTVTGAGIS